jgi:hypothetical protein
MKWVTLKYNDKRRFGLDMGDDERPGTANRTVLTPDGVRTFKKSKMEDWQEVDVDLSNLSREAIAALAGLEADEVDVEDVKRLMRELGNVVIQGKRRSATLDLS